MIIDVYNQQQLITAINQANQNASFTNPYEIIIQNDIVLSQEIFITKRIALRGRAPGIQLFGNDQINGITVFGSVSDEPWQGPALSIIKNLVIRNFKTGLQLSNAQNILVEDLWFFSCNISVYAQTTGGSLRGSTIQRCSSIGAIDTHFWLSAARGSSIYTNPYGHQNFIIANNNIFCGIRGIYATGLNTGGQVLNTLFQSGSRNGSCTVTPFDMGDQRNLVVSGWSFGTVSTQAPVPPPPSPTPTSTPTNTPTISVTPSVTPSISVTPSVTPSFVPTSTPTPTITPTISVTPSITPTISVTPSITPTISVTPSITPTISVTPSITPTNSVTPTQSFIRPSPSSQNIIKAQLNNLIACHNYKVYYSLHYSNKEYLAYLDKTTFEFTANNSTQNIFVLLTQDIRIKTLLLEIKVLDLSDNLGLTYSNFVICEGFHECDTISPITPTSTPTPTPTPTSSYYSYLLNINLEKYKNIIP